MKTRSKKLSYHKWQLNFHVRNGDVEAVRTLIDQKININETENDLTAAHVAATNGHVDMLKLLIEAGANVNSENERLGRTPLHLAKNLSCVKILIKAGANVNMRSKAGIHALHWAVWFNKFSIVKFLVLFCRLDINVRDIGGFTPLHVACSCLFRKKGYDEKIIKFLIMNKASVNLPGGKPHMQNFHMLSREFYGHFNESLEVRLKNLCRFSLKYDNSSLVMLFGIMFSKMQLCEIYLKHVALLLSLGQSVHLPSDVERRYDYNDYLNKCKNELLLAKKNKTAELLDHIF